MTGGVRNVKRVNAFEPLSMALNNIPAAAPELPAAWIPTMVGRIVARFQPERIILFGSHARGEAHAGSDIDLLVVMPGALDGAERRKFAVEMLDSLSDLPVYKDVVVTTPSEIAQRGHLVGSVLHLALREGKVLYARQ